MTGAPILSLDDLAGRVPDGAMVAIAPDYSGVPVALAVALARRGARGLHLLAVPQAGMAADILVGAGCVATVEAAAIILGELGLAPRFTAAVKAGSIRLLDSTCPAIHAGLQAAEKGVPFMPLRGVLGSDLVAARPDWRVAQNPFAEGEDPILLLPAIRPDFALIHAPLADRQGNLWIGRRRELMTMAHAAAGTLATVEEVVEGDLLADERMAAGTIPALYVSALAEARRGAWPLGLFDRYEPDAAAQKAYAEAAASEAGFAAWLEARGPGGRAAA